MPRRQPDDHQESALDGNKWLLMGENSKYSYIVGFLEGMFLGHCFTTWGLPGDQMVGSAWASATDSYNEHWNRFVGDVAYRQFFDGLDKLYSDYRNRKIRIKNGMWIVMSEISGQPAPIMETMIEEWRREASGLDKADTSC